MHDVNYDIDGIDNGFLEFDDQEDDRDLEVSGELAGNLPPRPRTARHGAPIDDDYD
jgi:hypothetical protein